MLEVTVRALAGRNAIACAAIMYFLALVQSVFAEAIINPACSKLTMIIDEIQRIKAQEDSLGVGDTARRCPLYKQQIEHGDEMIRILESDLNRCGRGRAF
jgi:hypothetical protein